MPVSWSKAATPLVFFALLLAAGCTTIEFSKAPELPVVAVEPPAVEQPSPPPLPPNTPVPAPAPEPAAPAPALSLSIQDAIELALEKNLGLQVEQIDPASARTLIAEQRALFDPAVDASLTRSKARSERDFITAVPLDVPSGAGTPAGTITIDERAEAGSETYTTSGDLGVSEYLPTGTTINASVSPSRSRADTFTSRIGAEGSDTLLDSAGTDLSISQHLLQGFGLKVNLAGLRQAKLAALSSDYEFRAAVENLVAEVETTYWDYTLAQEQINILEESLTLAQNQAKEVEERIRVGVLAETERAAADAEVALRQNLLIDGRSRLNQLRLQLLRLLNPDEQALEHQDLAITTQPVMPEIDLDTVPQSIAFAQQMRPELNQARLLIQRDELSLITTRNGLLPQLDLILSLSKGLTETEYAQIFRESTRNIENEDARASVGAVFSYPIGNRAARARHNRAEFSRDKDEQALANLAQLVEQDVRSAYIELRRAREQIAATAATRKLQETVARTEAEKMRLGSSTSLLVAQAQRDLLEAQINEVEAAKNFLQAIVNLYRLDGSLLIRRGIDCPGAQPIKL